MNNGYGDADEVSFAATTTTPDFLGSPSSKDQRNNPFHEQTPETGEDGKKKQSTEENEQMDKNAEASLHESSVSPPIRWENHIKSYPGHDSRAFHNHNRSKPNLYTQQQAQTHDYIPTNKQMAFNIHPKQITEHSNGNKRYRGLINVPGDPFLC